jgi:hypothetical protein
LLLLLPFSFAGFCSSCASAPVSRPFFVLVGVAGRGVVAGAEHLRDHARGGMDEPELKIIDVFICKLRKKLANASNGKNTIETVWGRGYVLREPTEDEARIPA